MSSGDNPGDPEVPRNASRPRVPVAALVATGFVLRLVLALRAGILEHDGAYYAGLAAALLRGDVAHAFSTVWPPLYPLMVAALAWPLAALAPLTPERLEFAARMVSVLAGTVSLALLHRLARAVAGPRVALAALALAACHPRLVQYSAAALTESAFIALVLAGLVLVAEGDRQPDARRDLAAGIAFGSATSSAPRACRSPPPSRRCSRGARSGRDAPGCGWRSWPA